MNNYKEIVRTPSLSEREIAEDYLQNDAAAALANDIRNSFVASGNLNGLTAEEWAVKEVKEQRAKAASRTPEDIHCSHIRSGKIKQ